MARSVNLVILIGNLTRDTELRHTTNGRPVASIGLATNRAWKTETGETKEETEFHRIVAWGKLAETCGKYLKKGKKVYFRGRNATRTYITKEGTQKSVTEVIADDMMMLSSAPTSSEPAEPAEPTQEEIPVNPDEIPF